VCEELDTEGLFRIPGQQTEIQKLKEAFDRGRFFFSLMTVIQTKNLPFLYLFF